MQGLRGSQTANASIYGSSLRQKSVIGTPNRSGVEQAPLFADVAERAGGGDVTGVEDRLLRDKQSRYAEKVQVLNESRIQDRVFPVLRDFATVEEQGGDDQVRCVTQVLGGG